MIRGGGAVKGTHLISESLENLYTLDQQDESNTNDEERERMRKYIDGVLSEFLTERQRRVFKMYYGEGLNSSEIASRLGISPQAARGLAASARRKVQRHKKIFLKTQPQ